VRDSSLYCDRSAGSPASYLSRKRCCSNGMDSSLVAPRRWWFIPIPAVAKDSARPTYLMEELALQPFRGALMLEARNVCRNGEFLPLRPPSIKQPTGYRGDRNSRRSFCRGWRLQRDWRRVRGHGIAAGSAASDC